MSSGVIRFWLCQKSHNWPPRGNRSIDSSFAVLIQTLVNGFNGASDAHGITLYASRPDVVSRCLQTAAVCPHCSRPSHLHSLPEVPPDKPRAANRQETVAVYRALLQRAAMHAGNARVLPHYRELGLIKCTPGLAQKT